MGRAVTARAAARLAATLPLLLAVACATTGPQPRGPNAPVLIETNAPEPVPATVPAPAPAASPSRPIVAIVIDDVGESSEQVAPFLAVPLALSFAVLPTAAHPADVARQIHAAGHDVLVHVPMEPVEADFITTPGFLNSAMDDVVLRTVMAMDLERVPGATGANNHMGSRLTRDARAMAVVMTVLKARGMYFLDSRTDPGTVAYAAAADAGVPAMQRDVFLDNEDDEAKVMEQLRGLETVAMARGCAVAIGHPRAATLTALRRYAADPDRTVDCVPAGRLPGLPCSGPARAP